MYVCIIVRTVCAEKTSKHSYTYVQRVAHDYVVSLLQLAIYITQVEDEG